MFSDLTPIEQQRVAKAFMPQMGGRSPADLSKVMAQLQSNEDLAQRAMSVYEGYTGTSSDTAGNMAGNGSRVNDMLSALMSQGEATQTAPVPPSRPKNVAVASNNPNNVMPPSKPVELTGEDRVAKAGGPGSTGRNSTSDAATTQVAEGDVDPSMSATIMNVLAGLGIGGGAAYAAYQGLKGRGNKQMPPEVAGEEVAPNSRVMTLPPEAGGDVVPRTATNIQDRFSQAFADDIPDAQYREVPPTRNLKAPETPAEETTKQVGETKKLTGPKEVDDRDNVKKADGKTIKAEDETEDAGVRRTLKATTAKEKIKPKVRVK